MSYLETLPGPQPLGGFVRTRLCRLTGFRLGKNMGKAFPFFGAVFFLVCLGAFGDAMAAGPKKEAGRSGLDSAQVRKFYMDGDFDPAIKMLEDAMKQGRNLNHHDSVFAFKHLGVMYAAKYETRELGKMYMHKLLMVEPTARIMDMYASDMIYMIFKNIQDEFESTRVKLVQAEKNYKGNTQSGPVEPVSRERDREPKKGGSHVLAWVGVSAALVAAGVVTYFVLLEPEPEKPVKADF